MIESRRCLTLIPTVMKNTTSKQFVQEILSLAAIQLNGNNPWDIQVHHEGFYKRVLGQGTLGLGESYMEGWWDCEQLDVFFHRVMEAKLDTKVRRKGLFWEVLKTKLINFQSKKKALADIQWHYDIGNELYEKMLDKHMAYSCGYWKNADNLDQAQTAKLDLICKKVGLKPGMKILDIGCGWGSFAKFAAEKYQVEVVGVTLSENQVKLGQERCKGLPVEIRLQDYREVAGTFDRIISIGMFEHVGPRNYATYMKKAASLLKEEGLFLLHTIGSKVAIKSTEPWIEKYIFPNSVLPSAKQIVDASAPYFMFEDWHNFGADYDKTLMAWYHNFQEHWPELKKDYDEKFKRMWDYYLLHAAGSAYRFRKNQLWQIVFSKEGVKGGYESIR